jgi:hypothetical protein
MQHLLVAEMKDITGQAPGTSYIRHIEVSKGKLHV